ncbi:hypothetical protein Pelo_12625 [Pelomyxa schiedti]|nr:hypothetical protein Pelo_12625 [Pelomyxa schiedti]
MCILRLGWITVLAVMVFHYHQTLAECPYFVQTYNQSFSALKLQTITASVDKGVVAISLNENGNASFVTVATTVAASTSQLLEARLYQATLSSDETTLSISSCATEANSTQCVLERKQVCFSEAGRLSPGFLAFALSALVILAATRQSTTTCAVSLMVLLAGRPFFSFAQEQACEESTVWIILPQMWSGNLRIDTGDAAIALNSPLSVNELHVSSDKGAIAGSWESTVQASQLELWCGSGTAYISRTTLIGDEPKFSASTVDGYVTFSEITVPGNVPTEITIDACEGRVEVAHLRGFNGVFNTSALNETGIAITGNPVKVEKRSWESPWTLGGTIGKGTGGDTLSVYTQMGNVVIFNDA